MRVLLVSNLYPPYYVGGHELVCREIVEALTERGHEVRVLTSRYGVKQPCVEGAVYRWLETDLGRPPAALPLYVAGVLTRARHSDAALKDLLCRFDPDIVYISHLTNVSLSLAFAIERLKLAHCYFVGDTWLARWEHDPWYSLINAEPPRVYLRLAQRLLKPALRAAGKIPSRALTLPNVHFVSHYLKDHALRAGKPVTRAEVIHSGIDPERFPYKGEFHTPPRRLLYVGQVVRHKGVHTAIEALSILVNQWRYPSLQLTIVGGSLLPQYVEELHRAVECSALEEHVQFVRQVPRDHLPSIYKEHDVLVFPSVIDEGFPRVILEAFSSGLPVVATATGGSSEILQHGVNALVFPKEDAGRCATQIKTLLDDHELFQTLRKNARRALETKFRFQRMIDTIEDSLKRISAMNH
jgi:glycosyltransferase involved in cell wall biosynthesis